MRFKLLTRQEILNDEQNRYHSLPTLSVTENLQLQQTVKLVIEVEEENRFAQEKHWVRICAIERPFYYGEALDDSQISSELKSGFHFRFLPEHVFQTWE